MVTNMAIAIFVLVQNKLPKPVKLRPCGAQLYGFYFVINYA